MAFVKKTWKDRLSQYPTRRTLTEPTYGTQQTYDVARAEGVVTQEGDAFSATNMNDLEDRIESAFDAKQDTLTAGENITIDENNVISAAGGGTGNIVDVRVDNVSVVDENHIAQLDSSEFGTTVVANPVGVATDNLLKLEVGDTIYAVPEINAAFLSDFYSTTERVVGTWIDGKPLYQRSWDLGSNVSIPNNNWYTSNIPKDGIERIISAKCAVYDVDGGGAYGLNAICYESNIDYVRFCASRSNGAVNTRYITLQYTKTTDTAGTGPSAGNIISLPSIYSTQERQIGVWEDGKPLYQCTWDFGSSPISLPRDSWVTVLSAQTQIDQMVSAEVICGTYLLLYCEVSKDTNNSNINIKSFEGTTRSLTKFVLCYTKTADTAGAQYNPTCTKWVISGKKATLTIA